MGFASSHRGRRIRFLLVVSLLLNALLSGGWVLSRGLATADKEKATPAALPSGTAYQGVPAEFERGSAIVLGCNDLVAYSPTVFTAVVAAVHDQTDVLALVNDEAQREQAIGQLVEAGLPPDCVDFLVVPENAMWVRDYGGIFTRSRTGKLSLIKTQYVETERHSDDAFPRYLAGYYRLPMQDSPLVIEGGNVLSNGAGLTIGCHSVIAVNGQRGLDVTAVSTEMRLRLGLTDWCGVTPLEGEPTHHADMFITLLDHEVAVVGSYDPGEDPVNARILDDNARQIAALRTRGQPMKVLRIPMPPHGDGVWRTYTNVLFANGTLLVPTYPNLCPELDEKALVLYRQWLPGWKIVPIDVSTIIAKRGALHCLSLNVPEIPD